ncbi:MAG: hypothetical protein K5917_04440 [Clostridiales bacterium]|nr:hypothetical protein [Clostridiales bacterium]
MADILGVTAPLTHSDTLNKNVQTPIKDPTSLNINVVTPERVVATNQTEDSDKDQAYNLLQSQNSVFSKFITELKNSPALSENLEKLLFDIFSRKDRLTASSTTSTIIKNLTEGMEMDKAGMLKNLIFQQNNQTKFEGEFFTLLQNLENQLKGTEFELRLANFLKAYDSFFSIADTTESISYNLKELESMIPKSYADKIRQSASMLMFEQPNSSIDLNLQILKEQVVPTVKAYVMATNDFGPARDAITLLIHNIARLNLSSKDALIHTFEDMIDYCRFNLNMPENQINLMEALFAQNIQAKSQGEQGNNLFDGIINLLTEGSKSSTSSVSQSFFKEAARSLVLDQSVFMPFNHIVLPVSYNGRFMFAEMWIEKNHEDEYKIINNATGEEVEMPKHIFLSFDIKNLGYFEAAIEIYNNSSISLNLSYPPTIEKSPRELTSELNQIIKRNGLSVNSINVTNEKKLDVSKMILRKVNEGRTSVDVTV